MRPSSADPNAPYRDAISSLVDCNFFADDSAEHTDDTANATHPSYFAGLNPRTESDSRGPNATTEIATSSRPPVTASTILRYLRDTGDVSSGTISDGTVDNRLDLVNLSAETLLIALQTANSPDHTVLANLGVNPSERFEIRNRLAGIATNKSGFGKAIKMAAINSNDNPQQLIANLLDYLRGRGR